MVIWSSYTSNVKASILWKPQNINSYQLICDEVFTRDLDWPASTICFLYSSIEYEEYEAVRLLIHFLSLIFMCKFVGVKWNTIYFRCYFSHFEPAFMMCVFCSGSYTDDQNVKEETFKTILKRCVISIRSMLTPFEIRATLTQLVIIS